MTPNEQARFRENTRNGAGQFGLTFLCSFCGRSKSLIGHKKKDGKRICFCCQQEKS